MPKKAEINETLEMAVEERLKVPNHNHSFYLYYSDEVFDYWKCSMSSCGYIEKRPIRVEITGDKKVEASFLKKSKEGKHKTYEVQYHCRNCGYGFKEKFPFNMKATETMPCPKCGIDDSRKFIRKPK